MRIKLFDVMDKVVVEMIVNRSKRDVPKYVLANTDGINRIFLLEDYGDDLAEYWQVLDCQVFDALEATGSET